MRTLRKPSLTSALEAHGIFVTLKEHGDSYKVLVRCNYWKNKEVETTWSYSKDFTFHEIVTDPRTEVWLQNISGLRLVLKWEFQ